MQRQATAVGLPGKPKPSGRRRLARQRIRNRRTLAIVPRCKLTSFWASPWSVCVLRLFFSTAEVWRRAPVEPLRASGYVVLPTGPRLLTSALTRAHQADLPLPRFYVRSAGSPLLFRYPLSHRRPLWDRTRSEEHT